MSKADYKGYELIKAIHDGEIKDGTRIEVHSLKVIDFTESVIEYKNKRLEWGIGEFNTSYLFDDYYYFRVLEDNTEEIEELKPVEDGATYRYEWSEIPKKINELVKAVNSIRKDKSND